MEAAFSTSAACTQQGEIFGFAVIQMNNVEFAGATFSPTADDVRQHRRMMYEFKKGAWSTYAAQLDRRAENTQLYQVVRVAGDTLQFRAYTAIGSPYDSFDLVRRPNRPNLFSERLNANEPTRSFADGPAYTW
ncbi:MAG: hypothetical protein WEE89_04270 [Gemmatimonadota bacterium]